MVQTTRPRILWLLKSLGIGGAERLLLELLDHLEDFEFHPAIVADEPRELEHAFSAAGIPATFLGARGPFDVRWVARFVELRRRIGPDVIHLHNPYPATGGRVASAFSRTPIVYTEHNVWSRYHPLTRASNALTLPLTDRIVAVSEPVRRSIVSSRLGRVVAGRTEVIHNGIDVMRVKEDAAKEGAMLPRPSYGAVGHLRFSKGADVLVRAAAIIERRLPEAAGFMVGGGEHDARIRSLKAELGIQRLELLGVRTDARRLMGQFDVFVVPSRQEGLPLALLEAMALERPIVATTVGGIPDVLTHGEDALLVPPEDPHALAEAILRLLTDVSLATSLGGAAGVTGARRFTSEVTARKYANLYRDLLRTRSRR